MADKQEPIEEYDGEDERERRKAERKAAREAAAPATLFSDVPDDDDSDLTDAERAARELLSA